jgi:protein MAK16
MGEEKVDQELGIAMVNDETDEEEEEEEEVWGDKEFVSDISDDDDGLSDLENAAVSFCLLSFYFLGFIFLQNERFEDVSSEEESDEDDVSHENRHSLRKRKATTMPSSRKRPEKKTKSTCLRNPYYHSNYVSEGPRVEVEYEQEVEGVPPTQSALASW